MTLAATLLPTSDRHGETILCASGASSPVEHLALLLDAIVLDGNVRAMEAVACTLVRAGARMQTLADEVLSEPHHPRRLPLPDSASHRMALRTARRALAGVIDDPGKGATLFHRVGDLPGWVSAAQPLVQIGEFVFYRASPGRFAGKRPGC